MEIGYGKEVPSGGKSWSGDLVRNVGPDPTEMQAHLDGVNYQLLRQKKDRFGIFEIFTKGYSYNTKNLITIGNIIMLRSDSKIWVIFINFQLSKFWL